MSELCPEPRPECKYYDTDECVITRHHLYFPQKEYILPFEKRYRNLGENIVRLARCDHDYEHANNPPPEKPTREFMIAEIKRIERK